MPGIVLLDKAKLGVKCLFVRRQKTDEELDAIVVLCSDKTCGLVCTQDEEKAGQVSKVRDSGGPLIWTGGLTGTTQRSFLIGQKKRASWLATPRASG